MGKLTYKSAGVDIDKGDQFVEEIKSLARDTFRRGVISDIGSFGGFFSLDISNIKEPVLVSSTDGVGTKLKIAFMMDKHDTIGIDLVAMNVNDIITHGAEPLFFLDYFATSKLDIKTGREIIKGITDGCKQAGCALIGGETAEMPSFYKKGEYDLAGFVVGVVDRSKLIDGSTISVGDKIIGLYSSGLHSNGFSLVRKLFFDMLKMKPDTYLDEIGKTLGEELLTPTKIYAKAVTGAVKNFDIKGIVHITGGGFVGNIPRVLPARCRAVIHRGSWTVPAIFKIIQDRGKINDAEMFRTFNNGIGLILIVNTKDVEPLQQLLKNFGEDSAIIGEIEELKKEGEQIIFSE
jgi:phosphoribosylformylglycinamidine cyclo-ligase